MSRMQVSSMRRSAVLLALLHLCAVNPAGSLSFSYPTFRDHVDDEYFLFENSRIFLNAVQVTPDVSNAALIMNQAGRFLYKKRFKLWGKGKASFNSTFVLKIDPKTNPGGEGLAFILTESPTLPEHSEGEWLGIVNATSNGSVKAKIVAVEFDTRKSYAEDVDDNHVGLDVNSVYSIQQVPLLGHGVNLSIGTNYTVRIEYANQNITVFVSQTNETAEGMENAPVLSYTLNLSAYLSQEVYVGFSASTGNNTQLNCIRSWEFNSSHVDEDSNLLWVWIMVPVVVLLLVTGVSCYFFWTRRGENEDVLPRIQDEIQTTSMAPTKFKLKELQRATGRFNPKNKLGKGGFGTVYKGLLGDKEIAVKRVSKNSRQGKQEFIAEVTTIGSLRHKNLVKLIGWCYESHELLIVYEFMPNGSLDRFIYRDESVGTEMGKPTLSWERRRRIIFGVAQALDYLHNGCEKRVLHRDIKASNIMLDSDFIARLRDFGLARTIQQSNLTHHSTNEIAGTPGYMAPETFLTGRATIETDVYAFGVLMLEVVCGRRPGNQNEQNNYNNSIVYWLWDLYSRGRILEAVDSRMDGDINEDDMACVLMLGLSCCHPNPHERPSMRTVLMVLTREDDPPALPQERPAFVWPAMPPSFKDDTESNVVEGQMTPLTDLSGR
ncbi:probable L-type lectin-domain containing receptor kinase S.5 [Pyrus x bretschneideri]|uniref:probable L-type lectin-domain containing receptor kinase S.5 n=1 Tax=Pyrus x bretschneideri TaxID=225117 RepID=UPI00202DCA00|nr:probable L-type lectin-domain containing receptor kinase S.5 [Pyrus x bretschneideri]